MRHTLPSILLLLAYGVQTCSASQQRRKELSEDVSLGNLMEQNTTSASDSNFTTATRTTQAPPTTTTTTTTPSPTFPPAPTPVAPNTTVQTFAVACMLDGVSCIVDQNASHFVGRGRGKSGDPRRKATENNIFSRAFDYFEYFFGVLPFSYSTRSSTTPRAHSLQETDLLRGVSTNRATPDEQYYYIGSMRYQEALDDVGWDILNLSMEAASSSDVAGIDGDGGDSFSGVSPSAFAAGAFTHRYTSSSPSVFSLSTKYYAVGYLEGFVTYKKILNHYANTYRDTIESVLAESPAVRLWLQKNKEWLYRYISVKTAADASDVQSEKLSHVVMQVKGMADGFVDGCAAAAAANVCDPAVMGPLLTSSPEMAFITMQMFHELPDILAAHVTTVTPPQPPPTTTTATATTMTTQTTSTATAIETTTTTTLTTTTLTTDEGTTTTTAPSTTSTTSATDTATTTNQASSNPSVTTEEATPTTSSTSSSSPFFADRNTANNELLASLRLRRNAGQGSAMVKVVDGRAADLIAAHSTWGPYNSMMRQYKTYRWEGQNMLSMSSYPGLVASHDDYYLNGHGLAVMGSQLPMFGSESAAAGGPKRGHSNNNNKVNEVLVSAMKGTYQSVPTVFRSLVASYLGRSVRQWEFYFVSGGGAVDAAAAYEKRVGGEGKVSFNNPRLGSGADNKQWLIVDMKRFDGKHGSENGVAGNAQAVGGADGRKNVGADDNVHPMHSKGCVLLVESMPREVQKNKDGSSQSTEDGWELATYAMDLSRRLIDKGVFTLHGLAYLNDIAEANGQALMLRQNGTFFSYSDTNRGVMASVLADRLVSSRATASSFLRLNRFDSDDFASYSRIPNCTLASEESCQRNVSAMLTFGARGDLNPAGGAESYGYLWPFVGRLNLGAIDAKVTSRNSMMSGNGRQVSKRKSPMHSSDAGGSYTTLIISGPSNEDQPTFSFSTWPFSGDRHEGLPNTFAFPVVVVASAPQVAPRPYSRSATYVPTVGIVGATVGCIFGIIVVSLVTCTKYKKAPVRGYRPLKGSNEQLAWLDRERYVRPQGGNSHNTNNNSIIADHRHNTVGGGAQGPNGAQSQPHVGAEGVSNGANGTTLYSPKEGEGGEADFKFTYKNFRKAA